ncbi:MAG: hypothetical protein ABH885_07175, partial [Candidatus Omnitrophota bacterium]
QRLGRYKEALESYEHFSRFECGISIMDGFFESMILKFSRKPLSEWKEECRQALRTAPHTDLCNPADEVVHAKRLTNTTDLIAGKKPVIFALGRSWIKGYEKRRYLQYDALNPLMLSLRKFFEERGITYIEEDDENLAAEIEKARKGNEGGKVIVLAGQDMVTSKEFQVLREDKDVFLSGVDNRHLTIDCYMRLIEMINISFNLAFDREIDMDNPKIGIKKYGEMYIYTPVAEPMDYNILREIYRLQKFA